MLSNRYLTSVKNVPDLLAKIVDGVAPDKFNLEHLKSIGFGSSNDRGFVPLLKDLGFLTADGVPTDRYLSYRDRSKSKIVLGEALREAYEDVFHIREIPTSADRDAVEGLFRSKLNSTERVAQLQAGTFFALLKNADLNATVPETRGLEHSADSELREESLPLRTTAKGVSAELHYTIQVHLPATKEIEVYNSIFKSLRENLLS